ncbi:hypothetical protein J437_LFUL019512 [Ladona fulva]|uniref:Uncharacterized protein n=1 Tax=Ladona fulva TaxID=123851 RepID=A0A8K0KTC8_LADFU|nr:hypothetical protein J437_LFUL019512 [Ladona fulva]
MIVQLLTSHPPPSPAGVRFVSLGLCMLIACPSLLGHHEHEKKSIDWVVTAHAVKVPVTADLSAKISGFLPVHCIHQLLKSRAFTKHRVPIKNWIYRSVSQIYNC